MVSRQQTVINMVWKRAVGTISVSEIVRMSVKDTIPPITLTLIGATWAQVSRP